jgi:hypothetical protein
MEGTTSSNPALPGQIDYESNDKHVRLAARLLRDIQKLCWEPGRLGGRANNDWSRVQERSSVCVFVCVILQSTHIVVSWHIVQK